VGVDLQLIMEGTVDMLKSLALVLLVHSVVVIVVSEDGVVVMVVIEYVTVVPVDRDSGQRVVLVKEAELDWVYAESSDSLGRA
jgi:hypothetical protein